MSRTEGVPPYSSHRLDPQGGAALPALARERNDDTECEDKPERQQSDCGFLPEKEREVSVGINGFLSQDEKTVDDSDYKDLQSKYKGIHEETVELLGKSKARDSSQTLEETSCAAKEILDKLGIFIRWFLEIIYILNTYFCFRHHFHAGLPPLIQSGRTGNEQTEELERVDGGKREKSKKNIAYMVMLDSYVLQLLCVQKVLKEGTSEHEPLSQ
ncbi:hypothetical protein MKW94_013579 [Papaver nudicaule]|uniref:Uncharacterized protein n=1 Tax=Papaver nudicaule TaxID=74823 RepID=A0AA41RWR8_PAPNU|nr:hypothetical protein [Papaver nudicaule]